MAKRLPSPFSRNVPGQYGYRCSRCANIAFAFTGKEYPSGGTIFEYEISQRGRFMSESARGLRCQHCATAVAPPGNMVNSESHVVDIEKYAPELERRKNGERSPRSPYWQKMTLEAMGCARTDEEQEAFDAMEEDDSAPDGPEIDPLMDKKSSELKMMASALEIRVPANTNKANIIALIRAAQDARMGGAPQEAPSDLEI